MKYFIAIFFLSCSLWLAAQPARRLYTQSDNEKMLRLLDSTHNELLKVANTLNDSQFFYQIDTVTWSANDIVEHLGLIDEGYVRELWFTLAQPGFPASYVDSARGAMKKHSLMPHNRKREKRGERICLGTDTAINRLVCGFLLKPMTWQRSFSRQMLRKTLGDILFLESLETAYGPSEMLINWVYFSLPIA